MRTHRVWRAPFCRYLLIGGSAWLVDFAVFVAVVTPFGIVGGQLTARLCGAVVAFLGHKLFVFHEPRMHASILASQAFRYAALWLFSYVVSTIGLILVISYLMVPNIPAKVLVESLTLVLNYVLMRSLIFRAGVRSEMMP